MPGRSVFTVLQQTAAKYGAAQALFQPIPAKEGGGHQVYSWNDWATASLEIALGLHAAGLKNGDLVCILCETRAEFYLVDLGIMGAGGVSAALYTAYPVSELVKSMRTIDPRFLFIESPKTLADVTVAAAAQEIRLPEVLVLMTGEASGALSLEALRQRGRTLLSQDPAAAKRLEDSVSPADPAILYLTSGATGEPKMGLVSHAAVVANLDMAPERFPIRPSDSMLVFLPSAHIAQRIVLELIPMRMGTSIYFSEGLARMPAELKLVRPTVFLAPPRVWERMYATINGELKKRPPLAQKLFEHARTLGLKAARLRSTGREVSLWMRPLLAAADHIVFSKVKQRLGGRIRIAASGAAPLGKELAEFFAAIQLPLLEGYGITEAGVITFNPLNRPKAGSIGVALPGVDLRLAADGELQIKSPCLFEGYYKDPAATASVMTEDGWFCSGDVAEMDQEGYWYITGRKKELIVSSNGKKIYPSRVENLFKTEPLISQVVLIGDKKPYLTALLTLNPQQAQNVTDSEKAVAEVMKRVNRQLADFERIRRVKILERDFSIDQGELTPTMKIRRSRVLENHRELVSQLYLGREESE